MDEQLKQNIQKQIQDHGVAVQAIIPAELADKKISKKKRITRADEGYVYSIGQHEKGRPEILIFCGPCPNDKPMNGDELFNNIIEAQKLINHWHQVWESEPYRVKEAFRDEQGRVYMLADHVPAGKHLIKDSAQLIKSYYGTDDYELFVLIPVSQKQTTLIDHHNLRARKFN